MDSVLVIFIIIGFLILLAAPSSMLYFLWQIRRELAENNLILKSLNHQSNIDLRQQTIKLEYILKNVKLIGSKLAPEHYRTVPNR